MSSNSKASTGEGAVGVEGGETVKRTLVGWPLCRAFCRDRMDLESMFVNVWERRRKIWWFWQGVGKSDWAASEQNWIFVSRSTIKY